MSVYVDTMRDTVPGPQWPLEEACHLFADGMPELLRLAGRLGLGPHCLHAVRGFPHFDLTRAKRRRAIEAGARPVSQKWAVEWRRKGRSTNDE